MGYKLRFRPAAAKDLYKLTKKNKELGALVVNEKIPNLLSDPFKGRKKKGDLSHIRSYDFNFGESAYRILYEVKGDIVRIFATGLHDVSYRKVKRRPKQ